MANLVDLLAQEEVNTVRHSAAYALGEIGPTLSSASRRAEAMAGLVRSIENDQDMETPVYAATALIAFGADARTAEPALAAMMRSGNVDEVRVAGDL